jgi:starch synthase (maltosyl-transferring)
MTAGYVCVSRSTADLVRATTGAPPPMVEVIGNGVDVSLADAAQPVDDDRWPVPAGELALLFLGRLADQKDPESAIRSLADHRRRHPASLMHLVMVGDGPMRGACERITQQERVLAGHVHVVGAQVDPYAWLLRADGLINTSRWEGMPNAILEAMAARRCVIATPVDGNAEVVVDGETGWLRSGAGIVDAMREFEADAFKRAALGDAGRRRVQEHFSIQRTVRAWEELIAGCLGS